MLGILLNLDTDIGYKQGRFCDTLPNKDLEFVLSNEGGIVALNLGFLLLLVEVNPISEK